MDTRPVTDKGHFTEVNPLEWASGRFTDVSRSVYFPFICKGSTNEFQCTDQKPPRIDTLKAEKLINVSNQCIFFLIKSSRDPTFCGIFVCGRLQFKLKRQFISPRIGYYRESGFDSRLKARPIRGTRRMHVHVVDVLQGWEYWGEGKNKKWSRLEKVLLFWMSF